MPESKSSQGARDDFIARLGWGATVFAILVGLAIIGCHLESGARRWTAAAWQFALNVPGSPATWGVFILAAGLLMLYGKVRSARMPYHVGCLIGFSWYVLLCGAALMAFISDPEANPLGPIVWGFAAFIYGSLFNETKAGA